MRDVRTCTKCNVQSDVIDSRARKSGWHRRRECPQCKRRWGTLEIPEDEYKVLVIIASMDSRLEQIADGLESEANAIRNIVSRIPSFGGRDD
jgi:transcriptional regulator NrdR family protein